MTLITTSITAQNDLNNQAKSCVDTFFTGFHEGDISLMKSVMHKDLVLHTAYTNKEGKDILVIEDQSNLLNAVKKRPANEL